MKSKYKRYYLLLSLYLGLISAGLCLLGITITTGVILVDVLNSKTLLLTLLEIKPFIEFTIIAGIFATINFFIVHKVRE